MGEASLRRTPAGDLVAMLTSAAEVEVIEERDGWARVRVEGWIPATALAPGDPAPAPLAPPPPPAAPGATAATEAPTPAVPAVIVAVPAAAATAPGGEITGSVSLPRGKLKKPLGEGTRVLVLPSPAPPLPEITDQVTARLAEIEAEVARLHKEEERAMQNESFSIAREERDVLRKQRRALEAERIEILSSLNSRREAAARSAAVAGAVADGQGRFVISGLSPGEYTLYARLSRQDMDVEWLSGIRLGQGPSELVLDPSGARGLPPPAD
jgi:hypothetical protein